MIKTIILIVSAFMALNPMAAHAAADCTLLIDSASGSTLYKRGDCDTRHSPNSTFKIALALIGYDAGILGDEHTPAWPFKEGYTVNKPDDRQTTDPTLWEKNSVVWYSQKLTTTLGEEKFVSYVRRLRYGNMDVSGAPGAHNGLTKAWLDTSLQISPTEQAEFIRHIVEEKFDLSPKAMTMAQAILPRFETRNGWTVTGKTGTGYLPGSSDGIKHPQGWFVGWAQKGKKTIIFAKYIAPPKKPDMLPAGLLARDRFLSEFPELIE